jgi:hypothetical protein
MQYCACIYLHICIKPYKCTILVFRLISNSFLNVISHWNSSSYLQNAGRFSKTFTTEILVQTAKYCLPQIKYLLIHVFLIVNLSFQSKLNRSQLFRHNQLCTDRRNFPLNLKNLKIDLIRFAEPMKFSLNYQHLVPDYVKNKKHLSKPKKTRTKSL